MKVTCNLSNSSRGSIGLGVALSLVILGHLLALSITMDHFIKRKSEGKPQGYNDQGESRRTTYKLK